jgi:hypothetical protein
MMLHEIKVGQILENTDTGRTGIDRVLVLKDPYYDRQYPDSTDGELSKIYQWFVEVWVLADSYDYLVELDETGQKTLWLLEDFKGFKVVVSI